MFEIIITEKRCNGCGKCIEVCPKGPKVFRMEDRGNKKVAVVKDVNYCINCGSCAAFCPKGAIKIEWLK